MTNKQQNWEKEFNALKTTGINAGTNNPNIEKYQTTQKAPFFEEELAGVIAKTIIKAMTEVKNGKFNFEMKLTSDFVSELLSQQLKQIEEGIEKMMKGRKAITGNWKHLLPNSEQYNQALQDIKEFLRKL